MSTQTANKINPRGEWQQQVVDEIVKWRGDELTWRAVVDLSNLYDEMIEHRFGEAATEEGRKFCRCMVRAANGLAARMVRLGLVS